jgi:hypothetical protein
MYRLCAQVKIIMQVSSVNTQSAAAKAAAQGGLVSAFVTIGKTEGFLGYWRGNVPQARGTESDTRGGAKRARLTRHCGHRCSESSRTAPASCTGAPTPCTCTCVAPHSPVSEPPPWVFHSYEKLKSWFADKDGKLSVPARLAAGAGAAAISTLVRHMGPVVSFEDAHLHIHLMHLGDLPA